jgi:hypothetical protein
MIQKLSSSRTVAGGILAPPPACLHLETARELDCGSAEDPRRFVVRCGESRLVQFSETAMWLLTVARDELPVDEAAAQLAARTGVAANGTDVHRYYQTVIARLEAVGAVTPRRHALAPLIPAGRVRTIAPWLAPLFRPWAVTAVTAVSLGLIVLAFGHGLRMTDHGGLVAAYALFLPTIVVHELGHAAATVYHGARPGDVRVAIGPTGPRFHTDVTDAWRLPRSGRVTVDLGGVYLQTMAAAAYGAAYLGFGWPVMATAMVLAVTSSAISLAPMWKSDGAWVVADLAGPRNPAGHPGIGAPFRILSRAGRMLAAVRWLVITALAGCLLAGGWRLAGELPSAMRRLWSGEGGGALIVAAMLTTITLAGLVGGELARQVRRTVRWAKGRGRQPGRAAACLPGEGLPPHTGQEPRPPSGVDKPGSR